MQKHILHPNFSSFSISPIISNKNLHLITKLCADATTVLVHERAKQQLGKQRESSHKDTISTYVQFHLILKTRLFGIECNDEHKQYVDKWQTVPKKRGGHMAVFISNQSVAHRDSLSLHTVA